MGETHTVSMRETHNVLLYNVAQLPVKSQHAAHLVVSSEENKVGTPMAGGAVLVAGAALESAAARQDHIAYVAAVVTAARYMGPEPGQCRCACDSINLLKIGILVQQHAAAKTILHSYKT